MPTRESMPNDVSETACFSSTGGHAAGPFVDAVKSEKSEKLQAEISEANERPDSRYRVSSRSENSDVWLHIYHCDPWTGYLNTLMLNGRDIPINHIGVEVYGEEWSFQYYEDCWDDPSVSGVIRCQPRQMPDYEYQDSVCLGSTAKTEDEVDEILLQCQYDYSSNSYHLTKRNCMTFAYEFSQLLETKTPFPERLKGICDVANNSTGIGSTIDYGWSWAKWYMVRKHQQPVSGGAPDHNDIPPRRPREGESQSKYLCCSSVGPEDRQSSMWSLLLQPGHLCGGKMCEGGRAKTDTEESFQREAGSDRGTGRAQGATAVEKLRPPLV